MTAGGDSERTSRRAVLTTAGGPETIQIVSATVPAPRPGWVRVRVLASGVAYGDVLKRRGHMPAMPRHPYTPGYDLVGEVDAVHGDSRFSPGDRVAAIIMNGANADHALVAESDLVPVPAGIDPVEALCGCLNYVTAWQMLTRVARARPGERLLVQGAGGGTGTALLDVGRCLGLTLYGTASPAKHALVRGFGAEAIDYRREDFVAIGRRLPGAGFDIVTDGIGGRHLQRSHAALRAGGRLLAYGIAAANHQGPSAAALTLLLTLSYRFRPDSRSAWFYTIRPNGLAQYFPGVWSGTAAEVRTDLATVLDRVASGELRPVVGAVLPLDRIAEAHDLQEKSGVAGKIVLVP